MNCRLLILIAAVALLLFIVPAATAEPTPPSPEPASAPTETGLDASTIQVSSGTVRAGDPLTYTIVLRSDVDRLVDLSGPVPPHTTAIDVPDPSAPAGITCLAKAGRIAWHGLLTAGEPVTLTFAVCVAPATPAETVIPGVVSVTDENGQLLSLEASSTVVTATNVTASKKTVDRATALPGDELTYRVTLVNSGNVSELVQVTDPIPDHTTYVPGSVINGSYDPAKDAVYWAGVLAPTSSRGLEFRVRIDPSLPAGTVITNTARIDDFAQPVERQASTTISAAPILETSLKSVEPATAASGDVLTYTLALTNTGSIAATAGLTDPIPAGAALVGVPTASLGAVAYDPAEDQVTWSGVLPVGGAATVSFAAEVTLPITATGLLTNTATIDDGTGSTFTRTATARVPLLRLSPVTPDIAFGETIDVVLYGSNLAGLRYLTTRVGFSSALEVVDVQYAAPGDWDAQWDNSAGTLDLEGTLDAALGGESDSEELATIRLRSKMMGQAALTIVRSTLSSTPPPQQTAIPHNRAGCTITVRTHQVTGRVLLQSEGFAASHAGATILVDGLEVATSGADGTFRFTPPSSSFVVTITMAGYLPAWRSVSAGGDLALPPVTLLGGDVVGRNKVVSRGSGCAGTSSETVPGPPDGVIDAQDLAFIAAKLGAESSVAWWGPDPCYPLYGASDPRSFSLGYLADLNGDGQVNTQDLAAASLNYGRAAPSPWP